MPSGQYTRYYIQGKGNKGCLYLFPLDVVPTPDGQVFEITNEFKESMKWSSQEAAQSMACDLNKKFGIEVRVNQSSSSGGKKKATKCIMHLKGAIWTWDAGNRITI